MKGFIKYLAAVLFTAIVNNASAQNAEMADTFRAEGKIYVVVGIILVVLVGLVLYLFMLDGKIKKLERMIGSKKQTKAQGKAF